MPDPPDATAETDAPVDSGADTGICPPGGTTLTWDNFARQFFVTWCHGCHNLEDPSAGVPEGVVFDTEAFVWTRAADILDRVVNAAQATAPEMPPPEWAYSTEMNVRELAIAKELDIGRVKEWLMCAEPSE